MRALLRLSKTIDAFTQGVGTLAYWLIPIVVLVGVWNVGGRYIGRAIGQNLSSNVLIELQWYLFSIIFLLGASFTLKHNGHVRVDVMYARWSPKTKAWVNLLGALLFLIPFGILLLYFSWSAVLFSWSIQEMSPDPGGLPRYPIKTFILISVALLIIQGISEIIKNLAIIRGYTIESEPTGAH